MKRTAEPTAYEADYYTWTQEQARFLAERQFERLDIAHLAEEVADMGRPETREFASRLAVIVAHLLKLSVQTDRTPSNERSWQTSVATQRDSLARLLTRNPGLKYPAIFEDVLADAWGDGRLLAIRDTGLDPLLFPETNPFTLDQLLDPDFWP